MRRWLRRILPSTIDTRAICRCFSHSAREIGLFLSHRCVVAITCVFLERAFPIFVAMETRCTPRTRDTRRASSFYRCFSKHALFSSRQVRFDFTIGDDRTVGPYLVSIYNSFLRSRGKLRWRVYELYEFFRAWKERFCWNVWKFS